RNYRLKVSSEDEALVRKTTKLINDKIIEFKSQFAGKDTQDYVSMVLIWFATEQNKSGGNAVLEQHGLKDKLTVIEQILDKALS
ncbi:cell division protein ZapA, partial [Acinetobacter baumannii]